MTDPILGALAEARALGFLGPGPLESHAASAKAFLDALGSLEGPALDLGSGGGVPGLLLAAADPTIRWLLLDNNRRRTSFLSRTVAQLGFGDRVDVLRASAQRVARETPLRHGFALVTSRSFGPPAVTAECAAGFLRVGGRLAVAEPPQPDPGRWPDDPLATLGLRRRSEPGSAIAVFEQRSSSRPGIPRTEREVLARPLW